MKSSIQALRAVLLLAALLPFGTSLFADDPADAQAKITPTPETALHEIGADPLARPPAPTAVPAPTAEAAQAAQPAAVIEPLVRLHGDDDDNNRVSVGDATNVAKNEEVPGNAVSVLGPLAVDGTVDGNAVSVLGSSTINGTVHGNAVTVLGALRLGSHAHVDGNVVSVGLVVKDPGAYVGGHIVRQGSGFDVSDDSEAATWWHHGLKMGRPLAVGPHLHGIWLFSVGMIVLYIFLALAFPEGTRKCGDTLARRPGLTFLTGVLAMIALPVVFILLCITVVGLPVSLIVLPLAVLGCVIFGRAGIYALVGRSVIGRDQHPALATLVGALIITLLYLIPVIGIVLWVVISFLGFSSSLAAFVAPGKTPSKGPAPVAPPAIAPIPPLPLNAQAQETVSAPAEVPAAALIPPVVETLVPPQPASAPAAAPQPPPLQSGIALASEVALPRAGFWIRMVALLIDALLIGALTRMHDIVLPALAAYGAILWKFKGSTIGGIIFGIKVVRLDARPVDWVTAVVRALACFISLIALGLGFIWIAFDAEKQGWHDKIAGTVVVRLPKGASLV
jgi:uncharacterized RDD family membrane protein YckC